jgi:uncharacterized membrane protein
VRFAVAAPWWAIVLLVSAVLLLAWTAYARPLVPMPHRRRAALVALRAGALLLVAFCVLRPVRVMPPAAADGVPVPILLDVSRSMQVADARGRTRAAAARDLVEQRLVPALAPRFTADVRPFGGDTASDLAAAVRDAVEQYRGAGIPGVVIVSDGGDTGAQDAAGALDANGTPVFTVGVGDPDGLPDLEVLDVTAGAARLADAAIDLTISAMGRGVDGPFDVRVLENGRPIDVRQVATAGAPARLVVTVAPPADAAAIYTVEIPPLAGEAVVENNRRSVLVEPPGRPRRVLIIEGAPGFEHSFLKRALAQDEGLEIDAVVRKGRDAQGEATYFVHAAAARAPQLTSGFPADRKALFQYDALILANVEHDALSPAQLELAAAFVSERGGGLLVLGSRSFGPRGLTGTPIEDVLPTGLTDRGNGVVRAAMEGGGPPVTVTPEGEPHPVMRIGATAAETARRWRGVPALAAAAALGGARPGAQVLALVQADDGPRPLVAVQRYGQGRSMVFTGEASWRWRMQLPAADRTFELFWRQAARWLASGAADPVSMAPLSQAAAGTPVTLAVDVRDGAFAAVTNADVALRVVMPDDTVRDVAATLADPSAGRYAGSFRFEFPGVYRVQAEARRGDTVLGLAERWALVGGADMEMAAPRLNDDVLRRMSRATGGEYLDAADASRLGELLSPVDVAPGTPRVRELWQSPWIFAAIVLMLSLEWVLRRRWGLR